jgi:hypothetical protein
LLVVVICDQAWDDVMKVLKTHGHLIVIRITPGNRTFAGGGGVVPVLHVVLFGHSGWARVTHRVVAQHVFYFLGRVGVH